MEPSLTVSADWEQVGNPLMRPGGSAELRRVRVSPSYGVIERTGAVEWSAGVGVLVERSSVPSVLADRNDPHVHWDWKLLSPTSSLGVRLGYARASVLASELQQTGIVSVDRTSTDRSAAIQWQQSLSERWGINAGVSTRSMEYDSTALTSYRQTGLSMGWRYELGEASTLDGTLTADRLDTGRGGKASSSTHSQGWTVGYSAEAGRRWRARVQLGAARFGSKAQSVVGQHDIELHHDGERSTASMVIGRHVVPSGAAGGYLVSHTSRWDWSYAVDERSRVGVSFDRTRSNDGLGSAFKSVQLGWSWVVARPWRLSWTWRRQQAESINGLASGTTVGVSLNYALSGH